MLYSTTFCLDAMECALMAPTRLECGADVERVQQRCYRVRQHCLAQGDYRFVILRFQIVGTSLVISRHPDPELRWHRHKLRVLREWRAFVVEHSTGKKGRIGEIIGTKTSVSDEY